MTDIGLLLALIGVILGEIFVIGVLWWLDYRDRKYRRKWGLPL